MIRTLFVSAMLFAVACTSPEKPKVVAVTEIGAPMGAPLTQMIGPTGGTLASADGTVTVTIPANAVSAMTAFTIVPIETKSPGGVRSYRLGPEGTTFTSPATITFKYTEADTVGSNADLFNIVFQDAERHWRRSATTRDLSAKTLTTETTHFSDWAMVRGANLFPPLATVKVNESTGFEVKNCQFKEVEDDLQPVGYECQSYDAEVPPIIAGPKVEGILGGNGVLGTVSFGPKFMYRAPTKKPTPNPVAVSVEVPSFKGNTEGKVLIFSSVNVTDSNDPGVDWPKSFTGSGSITRTAGDLTFGGTFTASGGRTEGELTAGDYTLNGTFTLTSGSMKSNNCDCTISGGGAPATVGIVLDAREMKHTVTVSAFVTAAMSCMPARPTVTCPSSTVVAVNWGNLGDPTCSGAATTTLSSLYTAAGSYARNCAGSNTTVEWAFTGAK